MSRNSRFQLSVLAAALAAVMSLPVSAQSAQGGSQAASSATPSATTSQTATQPSKSSAKSEARSGAQLAGDERKFVEKAAMHGMAEVELGKLAQQKASNEQVKQFGSRMVQDHGKANDELKKIAGTKNVTLPSGPDKAHHRNMERMSKLSGEQFDREYMKHMVKDHKEDVKDFEKQSKGAKDSDIKGFAGKTLPTLQEHLRMAQTTEDAVKGSGKQASANQTGK
ncbi:MAG TPA: DUF4142 domain-containing protein [Usitatibacter sp.]|nr:DUF4142 domain-containing protein [Usitatibacter sp.]